MNRPKESAINLQEDYLKKNENIQECDEGKQSLIDFNDLTSDDECWLVQCPKSINITQFDQHKIKLPGRTHNDAIEAVAEEYSDIKYSTLGFKHTNRNCIKTIPVKGRILFREKFKIHNINDIVPNKKTTKVPFPENLKERHPLYGANYQEKIKLSEEILNKLKDCKNSRKSSKQKRISKEIEIKIEEPITIKKEKKRKLNQNESNESEEIEVTPKKSKKSSNSANEISQDLAWINQL